MEWKGLAIRVILALAWSGGCAQAGAAPSPGMLLDFEAPAIDGAFADVAGDGFAASGVRFRTVRLSGSVAHGAIVTLAPVADGLRLLRDASAISGQQAASPALGGGYNDLLMEFATPLASIALATDDMVEDFVRGALKDANRREAFEQAGIDAAVVEETGRFNPDITALSPKSATGGEVSSRDRLPMIIGLVSGFLLWSLVITGASILLNSVMEEKANKILEVLLSSASATEILTGKVLGVAMLTGTVMLVWGGIGTFGLLAANAETAAMVGDVLLDGGMLGYFIAYAVGGYLMYAVLFAAIGAFCETPRDAQTLMGPIMMVLTVPILVMVLAAQTPDSPVVQILSWIPFFTPFLMSARAPSEPPMIEVVGTMAGMFAFALLMVWIAGRAFRAGALSDVKLSWRGFAGAIRGGGK